MRFLKKQKCYSDTTRYPKELSVLLKIESMDYHQFMTQGSCKCKKRQKKSEFNRFFVVTNRLE